MRCGWVLLEMAKPGGLWAKVRSGQSRTRVTARSCSGSLNRSHIKESAHEMQATAALLKKFTHSRRLHYQAELREANAGVQSANLLMATSNQHAQEDKCIIRNRNEYVICMKCSVRVLATLNNYLFLRSLCCGCGSEQLPHSAR